MLGKVWEILVRGMTADSVGDRAIGFRCILERDDIRGVSIGIANQLSIEMQLLYHVAVCILVLKTGRFDFTIEQEMMLMTAIAQRMVVNLPGIMAHQM